MSSDKAVARLINRINGTSKIKKPPLGTNEINQDEVVEPLEVKERKSLFITSFIDLDEWNKAKWRGVAFAIHPLDKELYLYLLFENREAAEKIFDDWNSLFNHDDEKDDIRIALIEGEVANNKQGYYAVIGSNIDNAITRAEESGLNPAEILLANFQRIQRMFPTDGFKGFDSFKREFLKQGEYWFAPAFMDGGRVHAISDKKIRKRKIDYRMLKDVSKKDIDAAIFDFKES